MQTLVPGDTFGRLTVVARAGSDKHKKSMWECLCECGNTTVVRGAALRRGLTRSCGCLLREVATVAGKNSLRHGHSVGKRITSTYRIWSNMVDRCRRENNQGFHRYGGRGIKVCVRWTEFDNFLADMGVRPVGGTIDRINNDGDYEPANCRWATTAEQSRNRSNNVWVEFGGERLVLTDMANKHGIKVNTLRKRLLKGWDVGKAIMTPLKER